jgi:hypothetical protein
MVILSAHASPSLAVSDGVEIPEGTIYLVKSEVSSAEDILAAVAAAVEKRVVREHGLEDDRIVLSQTHGEILRLIAEGYSNAGIANERSTTVRDSWCGPLKTFDELEALRLAKQKKETPAQTRKRRGQKSITYGQS